MNDLDRLSITVRTIVEPTYEEEFNEWQFEEHVPWILSVDGYTSVRRYININEKHSYMNLWTLNDYAAHDCEDHERKSKSPWGRRLKRYRKLKVDFYHKLWCEGEQQDSGAELLGVLRFDVKGLDENAVTRMVISTAENACTPEGGIRYLFFGGMDRGEAAYTLRCSHTVAGTEAWKRIVDALSDRVEVNSLETYAAVADTAYTK